MKNTAAIFAVYLYLVLCLVIIQTVKKSEASQTTVPTSQTVQTTASNRQAAESLTEKEAESEKTTTETTVQSNRTETAPNLTTEANTTAAQTSTVAFFYDDGKTAAATTISPAQFKRDGKIYYNGYYYTYYSEKRLPGTDLNIPGRHSDGNYVRDEENYIVLASCDLPKGTVVQTPFGPGKVYDHCPRSGFIDVYVSW